MTLNSIPVATPDLQIGGHTRSNSTLICAPVMADSVDQMLAQVRKAKEQGADLVEIRLDYVKNFTPNGDLEALIKQSVLPTLITYSITAMLWYGDMGRRSLGLKLGRVILGHDTLTRQSNVSMHMAFLL